MSGLFADNLAKSFAKHKVVTEFNLELQKGQIVGLLGPNGAGKSTTLQMLAGCLQPDSGTVYIDNQPLRGNRALLHKVGFLPEHSPLYATLSVLEQLNYAAELFDLDKPRTRERLEIVLDLCELTAVRKQLIGQLSKGFRQRVGIAQTLMHDPDIILLDEPTEGLDPKQIHALRQLIRQLGENHAVLLSSHLLNEVEQVCDRVIIMHEGRAIFNESLTKLENSSDTLESIFMRLIYHDAETTA